MEILEAAQKAGIATYVIGENFKMENTLVPLSEGETHHHSSMPDLIRQKNANPMQQSYDQFSAKTRTFFGKHPKQDELEKAAAGAQKELEKNFPNQRFVTVYNNEPQLLSTGFISSTWQLGTVQFRPTLNTVQGHIAYRSKREISVPDNFDTYAVIKLLPFSHKLNMIGISLQTGIAEILQSAILSDLIDELLAYGHHSWKGNFTKSTLKTDLKLLDEFSHYNFTNLASNDAGIAFFQTLLTQYFYATKQLPSTKDKVIFPHFKRRLILADIITVQVEKLFKQYCPGIKFKDIIKAQKQKYEHPTSEGLLNQFSKPYGTEVKFDHTTPLTPYPKTNLWLYQRVQSNFTEAQHLFPSAEVRKDAMTAYTDQCKFDLKKPPAQYSCSF